MTFKKNLLFAGLLFVVASCNQASIETTNIISEILANGQHIEVEKTNKETTSIGIITKHNYGTTHSFRYKITLDEMDIEWNGGSGEPKHLLFCKDTVYIHFLKNKWVEVETIDSVNQASNGQYQIQEAYQVYIDKRYFFKLLGDGYWVDTNPEKYRRQKLICNEFQVPNDNELVLE